MLDLQDKKVMFGLPIIRATCVVMYPDRFDVPLGIRNKLDCKKPRPFLLFPSAIPREQFVTRIHSSKIWPETEVIDPVKTDIHLTDTSSCSVQEAVDYLNALGFRIKYHLSDIAARNFLRVDGRVISIDEESVNPRFSMSNELGRCQRYVHEIL